MAMSFTQRLCAFGLLLACMAGGLFGPGSQAAPARTLRFEQLSVEQGLAQESVLAIAQDTEGFMWFGSQAGLSRFDGYRVTVFKNAPSDARTLVDNWVRVLHVDRGGRLWIGTDAGLDRFEPATQGFTHFTPNEPGKRGSGNRHVRAIIDDGKQGLWIATADGLQHLDPATGKFTTWHHVPGEAGSLGDDQLAALALDATGRLWIGAGAGLDSLMPGASRFVHHQLGAGEQARFGVVQSLLVDANQTLWVGSLAGLDTIKLGSADLVRRRLGPREGLKAGPITSLYQDIDGITWVGSQTDGLYRWQPTAGRFAQYRHVPSDNHSVADNQISAMYRDRVGTFWVGTWYAGVSRVDLASGGFARMVKDSDGALALSDNKVRAIIDDGTGKLWLGTNMGLDLLDPVSGAVTSYTHQPNNPNSLIDPRAAAIARDRNGVLWVGSYAGLTSFDPATKRFNRLLFAQGESESNNLRGLLFDRSGLLWVASRGGLHRMDPATRQVFTYRHEPANSASLADNTVRPLLEDRHGRFWIGTFNGLDLLDRATGNFTHYHHDPKDPNSLSHEEVHYLFEDKAGVIWVGTAAGLNRMDIGADGKVRFRRYSVKDGMADDSVASILQDASGQLWISTNTGISRFDQAASRWANYSAADGTVEGAYFDGSALHAPDGTLYFGGFNGITAFAPDAIRDNRIAPRAVITDFQIFNKSVATTRPGLLKGAIESVGAITLDATDSVFSLEFSALHFASPQRNRYAYQLQGFDENWVTTDSNKRFATYTNLDPGTYTFRVKAANKDGVWSTTGASLEITILPPYWKTLWFRTLVIALVLGSAFAMYRMRMSALRRQRQMLKQQVRSRTVEVEQQNRMLERQRDELEVQRAEAERRRSDAERQMEEVERQKENVELAHRNISTLSEIGREMTATLDLETIMRTVYRHVHHLMDARIFGIGFFREDKGVIEFPFSMEQGLRSQPYERSMADPNQFAVWCLVNRREIFINDVAAEVGNYIGAEGMSTLTIAQLEDGSVAAMPMSMMYSPLIVKERVMGVICVQSVEKNAYRRVHLDMLQTLAAHAAVALDNARAYQQLEETQDQLMEQEKQVRLHTEELALANRALQENDERLRLAKQKAEDATRQKSEFLANMSHEMRTPLAGVIGMVGFALRDALLQENTRDQLLRAQVNAQSLLTIINDLLDFSKIEAGKLSIENIDFALASTLENVVALFEEQAAAQSVEFEIELATELPKFVVGDPTRLRQVLVNLVGNAFKFTKMGSVKVRVERLEPPSDDHINMIRFTVQDTGIGIAPEALERLFQKFEQADSTTTRRYGGTGLGLAICRQLVELMGGDISVDSKEGAGSTFAFVLPLADGVPPPVVVHVPRAPHTHRLKVLCAEDFPTNQIIIRMMLEELGHTVDIAENGALAVQACAHARYDLILMDGRMPEMDGATATGLIRSGGLPDAPVRDQEMMIIALTANASDEDRARYIGAGMDDFLTKPIDEAALHFQLSRAIERQLQRGFDLPLMANPMAGAATINELDAMFGVVPDLAPAAPGASPVVRRSSDLKARMRAAFAGDVPSRLAELERAIAQDDNDTAGRLLHGIKGSAAYLDEMELHALCTELEVAADQRQWDHLRAAMPRLLNLLSVFETVI
jgi:signal transduction histidine kinase/ligand-binding sensor domain-containing protein/DNA-binding NarL/FixJ family response regulator